MSNFCPKCGAAVTGGFCPQCGSPAPQSFPPQYSPPGYPQAYRPKTPGYATALFIISAALLVMALAFGAWRLFLNKPIVTAYESYAQTPATPPVLQTPDPRSELPVFPSPEGVNLMALFYKAAPAYQNGNVIIKWDSEIKVQICGEYTQEEYDLLANMISRVNEMGKLPKITLVESGGNFVYWFVPQSEMASHLDSFEEGSESYYNYSFDNNYCISGITIAIDAATDRGFRLNSLAHFLMRGLGFLGDVSGVSGTDTALGYSEYLTENDYALLSMLYSPFVTPGMTADAAYDALAGKQQTRKEETDEYYNKV